MPPLASVVVTTYNQAPYIGPALDSVFAQTYRPDEVIVVDDGSTDETSDRIAPYRDRITYIRQPNQGVAQSRNTGIRAARGELLAFLDDFDGCAFDHRRLLEPYVGVSNWPSTP